MALNDNSLSVINVDDLPTENVMGNVKEFVVVDNSGDTKNLPKADISLAGTQISVSVAGVSATNVNAAIAELKANEDTLGSAKENVSNKKSTITNSETDYPNCKAVGNVVSEITSDGFVTPQKTSFCQLGKNIFDKITIEEGYFINWTNGVKQASNDFSISDYIKVNAETKYIGSGEGFVSFMSYYSAVGDENFISGAQNPTYPITTPAGTNYIRLTIFKTKEDSVQFEQGSVATLYEAYGYKLKNEIIPSNIAAKVLSKNLFNKDDVEDGYFVNWTNGQLSGSIDFSASNFIPVYAGIEYFLSGAGMTRFVTYYDANGAYISGTNLAEFPITPASDGFVRLTCLSGQESTVQFEQNRKATLYNSFGYQVLETLIPSSIRRYFGKWFGKSWGAVGDSITAQESWQPHVVSELGLLHTNYGVGGRRISGPSDSITAMFCDTVINALPTTLDLITVLGGTNDWAQDVTIGAADSTTSTEFNGALNLMISKLMARFPAKRICLCTTTYGELYAFTPDPWPNAYTNNVGLTTRDYAEAIRVACKRWGIPCIDIQQGAGWNTVNIRTYVNDDGGLLHPNSVGGGRIAEVAIGVLKSIEPIL